MALTDDEKFRLIELFQNETCIWEVTSRSYMDRNMAAEAWMRIARAMGGELTAVQTIFQSAKFAKNVHIVLSRSRSRSSPY